MIPKIIHYCWFGEDMPDRVLKCMTTWIPYLLNRGYKIRCWNEKNLPAFVGNKNIDFAIEHKLYAILSDAIRFWVLYNYGGIYLDTDVQLCDNFDRILNLRTYIGLERVEYPFDGPHFIDRKFISTAIIGTQPNNVLFKRCYEKFLEFPIDYIYGPNRRVIGIPLYEALTENFEFKVVNSIEEASSYEGDDKIAIFNAPCFDSYHEVHPNYDNVQDYRIADHLFFNSWVEQEKQNCEKNSNTEKYYI